MTTYAVHAQILTHSAGYAGSVQVPLFYLDSRVQGILNAGHAADIARGVLNPLGTIDRSDLDVRAYAVSEPGERMSGEFGIDGEPIPLSAFAGNPGHVCAPGCARH